MSRPFSQAGFIQRGSSDSVLSRFWLRSDPTSNIASCVTLKSVPWNGSEEQRFHGKNVLRDLTNKNDGFVLVCIQQEALLQACGWMLLTSIAKRCLLALFGADLFSFSGFLATSLLHTEDQTSCLHNKSMHF